MILIEIPTESYRKVWFDLLLRGMFFVKNSLTKAQDVYVCMMPRVLVKLLTRFNTLNLTMSILINKDITFQATSRMAIFAR